MESRWHNGAGAHNYKYFLGARKIDAKASEPLAAVVASLLWAFAFDKGRLGWQANVAWADGVKRRPNRYRLPFPSVERSATHINRCIGVIFGRFPNGTLTYRKGSS